MWTRDRWRQEALRQDTIPSEVFLNMLDAWEGKSPGQQFRMEGLRAASRVWAGRSSANALMGSADEVLDSAKKFASWLESGDA